MRHEFQTHAAAVVVILLGSGCAASAQSEVLQAVACEGSGSAARFVGLTDAAPLEFFEASASAPDPLDPNSLVIGFGTGSDPTTFVGRDFRASALPFSHRTAMDTIGFTIEAPPCQFISKVTYTQQGTGATDRTSVSAGGATWVVAGVPRTLGVFSNDPSLSGAVDLTSLRLTSVPVSITVSLFASTGSVAVTGAGVHVELLPLPPASAAP
jgi:hypothetical protein